jgi:hypothetical protein
MSVSVVLNAIDDDVVAGGKASQARAQVVIATASRVRVAGEKEEALRKKVDQAVGYFNTAALPCDMVPDIVQLGFGFRSEAMRHSAGRGLLDGETVASALFHLDGKLAHRLLRDCAPLVGGERGLRRVNRCQNLPAIALAFHPKAQGFLHCVFLAVEFAGFDCLADKCFLIGCKLYFHIIYTKISMCLCQCILEATVAHGQSAKGLWEVRRISVRLSKFFIRRA